METPLQYLPTILARSRACPLDLATLELDEPELSALLCWLCYPVCLRLRHLSIGTYTTAVLEKILSIVSPRLRDISSLKLLIGEYDTTLELPAEICAMSSIADLALDGFQFPWDSAMLSPSLKRLKIIVNEGVTLAQPTYAQFSSLYTTMVCLRDLDLTNVVPSGPSNEIIHMPKYDNFVIT